MVFTLNQKVRTPQKVKSVVLGLKALVTVTRKLLMVRNFTRIIRFGRCRGIEVIDH